MNTDHLSDSATETANFQGEFGEFGWSDIDISRFLINDLFEEDPSFMNFSCDLSDTSMPGVSELSVDSADRHACSPSTSATSAPMPSSIRRVANDDLMIPIQDDVATPSDVETLFRKLATRADYKAEFEVQCQKTNPWRMSARLCCASSAGGTVCRNQANLKKQRCIDLMKGLLGDQYCPHEQLLRRSKDGFWTVAIPLTLLFRKVVTPLRVTMMFERFKNQLYQCTDYGRELFAANALSWPPRPEFCALQPAARQLAAATPERASVRSYTITNSVSTTMTAGPSGTSGTQTEMPTNTSVGLTRSVSLGMDPRVEAFLESFLACPALPDEGPAQSTSMSPASSSPAPEQPVALTPPAPSALATPCWRTSSNSFIAPHSGLHTMIEFSMTNFLAMV